MYKYISLIFGSLIILFSISYDFIFKNPLFFGPSQLLLLFLGITFVILFISKKYSLYVLFFIFGMILVIVKFDYFKLINESAIIEKNYEKIDEKILKPNKNELNSFFAMSMNFIDSNQFEKYFSYQNEKSLNNVLNIKNKKNFTNKELFKKISIVKKEVKDEFFKAKKNLINADLNLKLLDKIENDKFDIFVYEWDAILKKKAIANIYIPKNKTKKYPIVFSVPGCGENLWSDYPNQTDPEHRLGLLASNNIVGATTIAICNNSEFSDNQRFESYGFTSNNEISDNEIALILWLRFLEITKQFDFIDTDKIGITGYSNGASIIKLLMLLDEKIKNVVLVGTAIYRNLSKKNYYNFPQDRIATQDNINFYYGDGSKTLEKILNKVLIKNNLNFSFFRFLLIYDYRKNFFFISGSKDTAIATKAKGAIKKNINELNSSNIELFGRKNLKLEFTNTDHNYSKENNILAVEYFINNFYNLKKLNKNLNYTKNNKSELKPVNYKINLKEIYVDIFNKKLSKINYQDLQDNKIKILSKNFRLNKFKENFFPISLFEKNINIKNNNIKTTFYTQKIFKEIHSYFYEFENLKKLSEKKISILITSSEVVDFEYLTEIINNNYKTILLILPGYSFSKPKHNTIGNISKIFLTNKKNPLYAGMSIQALKNLIGFLDINYDTENFNFTLHSETFESSFIALIYKILSNDRNETKVKNYLKDLEILFEANNKSNLPAILFIENFHEVYKILQNVSLDYFNFKILNEADIDSFYISN